MTSPAIEQAAKSTRTEAQVRASDAAAIAAALRAGWYLDPTINKYRHKSSSAVYLATPRWGRYACQDHAIKESAQ